MTLILDPQHALTFGPLNLIGTPADLIADGYKLETLGTDADWGNPEPIEQKVITWLQDGALVGLSGHDNREMFMKVLISAEDGEGLAAGEAALMLQTNRRNTLIWTPPDGVGAPCVFDVVMSHLEQVTDEMGELYLERTYGLRVTALPFVRARDLTTVTKTAPSGTQSIVSIDNCSSFTGWAATIVPAQINPVAPSLNSGSSGGVVYARASGAPSPHSTLETLFLTRTGLSSSLSGNPYLRVDLTAKVSASPGAWSVAVSFKANGVSVPVALQEGTVYWLDTTGLGVGGTLNTIEVAAAFSNVGPTPTASLEINDVSKSNVLGTQATNRQLARTIEVAGSARTQGSLLIEDASNALGSVLVYTCPAVTGIIQPNISGYRTSGGTVSVDATTVSGFSTSVGSAVTYDVPAAGLLPGGYLMLARVKIASAADETITWSAAARMGSNTLSGGQSGSTVATLAAGAWTIVTIGMMNLPPRKMGPNGTVRLVVNGTGPQTLVIDEVWLFNIEHGRLTVVECGTGSPAAGGAANRLWLDAPTVDSPSPAIYLGTAADRSDAYHAGPEIASFGNHEFQPPAANVFTVTSGSTASVVTLSHYRRFHTHALAA